VKFRTVDLIDEAELDLRSGEDFYNKRDSGLGDYFWIVSSLTFHPFNTMPGFMQSTTDAID